MLRKRLSVARRRAGASDQQLKSLFVPQLVTWDMHSTPPGAKRSLVLESELFAGVRTELRTLAEALIAERLLTDTVEKVPLMTSANADSVGLGTDGGHGDDGAAGS